MDTHKIKSREGQDFGTCVKFILHVCVRQNLIYKIIFKDISMKRKTPNRTIANTLLKIELMRQPPFKATIHTEL